VVIAWNGVGILREPSPKGVKEAFREHFTQRIQNQAKTAWPKVTPFHKILDSIQKPFSHPFFTKGASTGLFSKRSTYFAAASFWGNRFGRQIGKETFVRYFVDFPKKM